MNKLYKKNELAFALIHIVIYVVGISMADSISVSLGTEKSVTAIATVLLSLWLFMWIKKEGLTEKYGLCKSVVAPVKMLFYLPLVIVISVNLIFGVKMNMSLLETALYIISMLCVGFIEEVIFRGFLFKAMAKDNIKSAVIVSSVTFGIGHIVNLVNGSGADTVSTLLQVVYAIAIGFLFTVIFYRTKSLISCVVTHSLVNSLSVFSDESTMTMGEEFFSAGILVVVPVLYTVYILKATGKASDNLK